MRVITDIRPWCDPQRSGVGTYCAEITKALLRRGSHEYALFANGRSLRLPHDMPAGADVRAGRWPNKLLNAGFAFAGWPTVERLAGRADTLFLPNFGFFATRLPYAVTVHDLSFVRFPRFFSPKQRAWHAAVRPEATLGRAAAVIAVSEHTRQDVIELFGIAPEKVRVASPAADARFVPQAPETVTEVRARYGLRRPYFLFLGTIEPRKNLVGLIEAYDLADVDADLVIAGGSGWLNDDVFARAAASAKRDRIRFLGYVSDADKPALYGGAIALAYPSFYEGFGIPVLEAMSCGTPVVTSRASSLGEVAGDAALLVDPHSPADVAAALMRVAGEPGLAAAMRERGLARARRYSWDESAAKIEGALPR